MTKKLVYASMGVLGTLFTIREVMRQQELDRQVDNALKSVEVPSFIRNKIEKVRA